MRSTLLMIGAVLLLVGPAAAQTRGEGSVTFGAGGWSNGFGSGSVFQLGGGGEAVINRRVGVGGEVMLSGGGGDGWIETSFKADYRFAREQRATPFVSGGYTVIGAVDESSGYSGVNFGAGLHYPLGREAIKLEAREVVLSNGSRNVQYFTVRVSLTFR